MSFEICDECKIGKYEEFITQNFILIGDTEHEVDVEYSKCNNCSDEVIFSEQIKRNDCRNRAIWRIRDGLLSSTELIEAREILKLQTHDFINILGVSESMFSKYECNKENQHKSLDNLLRVCLEFPNILEYLRLCKV